ncbi:hypothetical protein BHE74_00006672 [Ensete ventricosum]|nr:hypothetical protein GW17_00020940 [Ensete ventricosum]RWW84703.1 hypothetical protein BHE74_00006672 [Ensete ventricosum]RZR78267.1 hypothetical protein BHM03_00003560 [Ensete ventricosum]
MKPVKPVNPHIPAITPPMMDKKKRYHKNIPRLLQSHPLILSRVSHGGAIYSCSLKQNLEQFVSITRSRRRKKQKEMSLLPAAKISELSFHNPLPLCSRPSLVLSLSLIRCRFRRVIFSAAASSSSSLRLAERGGGDPDSRRSPRHRRNSLDDDDRQANANPRTPLRSQPPSAPWLQQWAPPDPSPSPPPSERKPAETDAGRGGAIERIVYRLRNLGLDSDDDEDKRESTNEPTLSGNERLGELLGRSWNRPDMSLDVGRTLLPWEREDHGGFAEVDDGRDAKRKRVRAPTLAELTIEDSELRRLRRLGIMLRERITVPKAGVTQAIAEKIHDAWRKSELVRLKFHETLANDMKTAHELVEVG